MPELAAVKRAAFAADNAGREAVFPAVMTGRASAPRHLHLRQIERFGADNRRTTVFRIILGDLTAIVLHKGLVNGIGAIGLLQDDIALVFSIGLSTKRRIAHA